uniref:Uncharacterized protein n=2 Tax=Rhodosorus marinus TaxID=101924 RepID=A0A7S3EBY3_9RHOD|mmetsp:Transcript_24483/g.96690  ORF Transcript_24483/g.96690 Transcript_24483/m.96690 type:complete len:103 (+) Transcript_24483:213-521(+)
MKKRKSPTPKKTKKSPLSKAKGKKNQEEDLPSAGESSEDEMNDSADEEEDITQMVDDSQAEYIAFASGDSDLHDLVRFSTFCLLESGERKSGSLHFFVFFLS